MLRVCLFVVAAACSTTAQAADPPRPSLKQPVNYVRWMNEERARGITENAADPYRQAISAFSEDEGLEKLSAETDAAKWTSEQRRQLKTWLQKNAACLEQFAAAARTETCYFPFQSESGALVSVMLPDLSTIRAIARLMAVRARLRLLEGDADGATDDVATLLRASRHLQDQPTLIQYLLGLSIGELAYGVLFDLPRLTPRTPDYERILSKLRLMNQDPQAPGLQLQMERLTALDMAQRFAKDTDGDDRFDSLVLPKGVFGPDSSADNLPLVPPATFEAMTRQIDDYYDQWRSAWSGDFQNARSVGKRLEKEARSHAQSIVGLVGPSLSHLVDIYYRSLASRNGAQVVLELHAYRAEHGKWPANLDEGLSKSVARPRFDPFSGKPLLYQLKKGQPLLYSIGENGVDDRGEVYLKDGRPACGAKGDYVFWPR